jgi:DNA-binding transcriptional LysR family regulator
MRHLLPLQYIDTVAKAGSIRKAAETLAITSTALNRRILAMEEELGVPIFERFARGVRLSAAGEILVHHARTQLADIERVKSQIADLSGVRRGHIAIACSQALLPFFLPEQIAAYRNEHPAVTFDVLVRDRAAAEQALIDISADLALVFEPIRMTEFQVLLTIRQPVHAVMQSTHPLAMADRVRLRDCLRFPVALPTAPYGVRHLLELAVRRTSLNLQPAVESDSFDFLRHYAGEESLISFQLPIGLPVNDGDDGIVHRPIDVRDVPAGFLYFGQLRNRTLPVAAARFAIQMQETFVRRFDCD